MKRDEDRLPGRGRTGAPLREAEDPAVPRVLGLEGQYVQTTSPGLEPPCINSRRRQTRTRGSHGEAGSQTKAGPATVAQYEKDWSRKQGAGCSPGLRAAKRQQCPPCNKIWHEPPDDKAKL